MDIEIDIDRFMHINLSGYFIGFTLLENVVLLVFASHLS